MPLLTQSSPALDICIGSTAVMRDLIRHRGFNPTEFMLPHKLSILRHFIGPIESWKGVALRDSVFYELHVGTYTREARCPRSFLTLIDWPISESLRSN